jgi:hypothetical protein
MSAGKSRKQRRTARFASPATAARPQPKPAPVMATPADPWATPHPVDRISCFLGVEDREALALMPAYADIPEEFRCGRTVFNEIQRMWFFWGLKKWMLQPKPGIDHKQAQAHLGAIQQSWTPSHEHKAAAVAYLMSRWYVEPKAERGRR